MKQIAKDYLLLSLVLTAVFIVGFVPGFFSGRASRPLVQYIAPEREEPIRSYIISQRKAGMDEWEHIRIEEYLTDIEFVERRWGVE
jgi:hypothetical protein